MEKTKMLKVIADYDDNPVDVTAEVNFIWNIANKLRGTYQSDKYKDVIIAITIIRRFECALVKTKDRTQEIAKIFGELITLFEASIRIGPLEGSYTRLPYS